KYKDSTEGNPLLTAADGTDASPYTSGTQTGTAASRLTVTTSAQNLKPHTTLGTMTAQLQTSGGASVNAAAAITVNLSSSSGGGVFRDTGDTTNITTVTISASSASASFKYKDSTDGSPLLTAADGTDASPYTSGT